MNINQLLDMFETEGIKLWLDNENIKYRAPKGKMTPKKIELLKGNKSAIIEFLQAQNCINHDEENRFAAFPLTDMQKSYAIGRKDEYELGGVGCKSYVEIEQPSLDTERLEKAWHKVIASHDILNAVIDVESKHRFITETEMPKLQVYDFRHLSENEQEAEFLMLRQQLSSKHFNIHEWPLHTFVLSQFENHCIIHFTIDMIIGDFISVNIMINDLLRFYHNPEFEISPPEITFRDVVMYDCIHKTSLAGKEKYKKDKAYWESNIPNMSKQPELPVQIGAYDHSSVKFERKYFRLPTSSWNRMKQIAHQHGVTTSNVVLTIYRDVIARWSTLKDFCINVTLMNRHQYQSDLQDIVGDFTSVNVLDTAMSSRPFIDKVKHIQNRLITDIDHQGFNGVEVLREMARYHGENVIIPVVYTSTIGMSHANSSAYDINITYGVSETPQVLIDCQTFDNKGTLEIHWDIRQNAFAEAVINEMFETFCRTISKMSEDEQLWHTEDILDLYQYEDVSPQEAEPHEVTLFKGFVERLKLQPKLSAIVHGQQIYTYRELGERICNIYTDFKQKGLSDTDCIGLKLNNYFDRVASMSAVVMLGASFEMISHDEKEATMSDIVLTDSSLQEIGVTPYSLYEVIDMLEGQVIQGSHLEHPFIRLCENQSSDTKVVSYFSIQRLVKDMRKQINLSSKDQLFSHHAFDDLATAIDILVSLDEGIPLIFAKDLTVSSIKECMHLAHTTIWSTKASVYRRFIQHAKLDGFRPNDLRLVMLTNGRVTNQMFKDAKWLSNELEIMHFWQKSKDTLYQLIGKRNDESDPYPLIYEDIGQNQTIILDDCGQRCPVGVEGHVHLRVMDEAGHHRDADTYWLASYHVNGGIVLHGQVKNRIQYHQHPVQLSQIDMLMETVPTIEQAMTIQSQQHDQLLVKTFVTVTDAQHTELQVKRLNDVAQYSLESSRQAFSSVDEQSFATWRYYADMTALSDILVAFQSVGIFNSVGQFVREADIMQRMNVKPAFHKTVLRWLDGLVENAYISREKDAYSLNDKGFNMESNETYWEAYARVEDELKYSKTLFDYQKQSGKQLLQQVNGEINGLDLFFPQGNTNIAMAAYHENVVNKGLNHIVADTVKEICAGICQKHQSKPISILEVGAGVGATTLEVLPSLDDLDIEYVFTDISQFFLNKAESQFKEYPFMDYRILDINQDFEEQGFDAHSFDIILCPNVLHNSQNAQSVLKHLNTLLTPEGFLVMIEATEESYSLLTSLELKGGLDHFTDRRQYSNQTFLMRTDWLEMLEATQFYNVQMLPESTSPVFACGQSILINQTNKQNVDENDNVMQHYLNQLPLHLRPERIETVDALPVDYDEIERLKEEKAEKLKVHLTTLEEKALPETPLQASILDIWKAVLNNRDIGVHDNFYHAGGDSLLVASVITQMQSDIQQAADWNWDALMKAFLKYPTVSGIASVMATGDKAMYEASSNQEQDENNIMRVYQKGSDSNRNVRALFHAGTGRLLDYNYLIPFITTDDAIDETLVGFVYGDESGYLSIPKEELVKKRALLYAEELMALNAEVYELVGYCVGGFLAMETARILIENGKNVKPVITISAHLCLHKVENELLMECAYASIIGTDMAKVGYHGGLQELRAALDRILLGENRDIDNSELFDLEGEFAEIGQAFKLLNDFSQNERMKKIYEYISNHNFNGKDNRFEMLLELYAIFNQTYLGMIHYDPELFPGDVIVLEPEEALLNFYPVTEADIDWSDFVIGNITRYTIKGNHATCLGNDNISSIVNILKEAEVMN